MINPASVAFDIDGVVADTMSLFLEIARDVHKVSCFVDDRLDTCELLHDVGILPILYKQPWNRSPHPYREIDSWKELEALIDF